VLGALTFPDILYSTGTFITALCGTIVALFLAYREKSLVVVAIGAIITVYLTGLVWPLP
jgi:branched-subunit amino acid transport protein